MDPHKASPRPHSQDAVDLPASTDFTLEPDLAELELQVGVIQSHDVSVLLAQGAVAARRGLLPALALPQMQPAVRTTPHDQHTTNDTIWD